MPNRLGAAIDSLLQDLIVASARRRWPALRLVPARWLRPAAAPAALRCRRVLSLAVLAALPLGFALVFLVLGP